MNLILLSFFLLGCHEAPLRCFPEHKVNGIRYAYIAQGKPGLARFVVYANGEVSPEFSNCMEQFYHPRKFPLPEPICRGDLVELDILPHSNREKAAPIVSTILLIAILSLCGYCYPKRQELRKGKGEIDD